MIECRFFWASRLSIAAAEMGQEGKKPGIDPAIIEELMKGYQRPEDLTGPGGIMEQLTKRFYERGLGAVDFVL
jgi:hypothetical protein